MKSLLIGLALLIVCADACGDNSGIFDLKCWTCSNAVSWKECNEQSTVENCSLAKPFCMTTFSPSGGGQTLSRQCALTDTCTYSTSKDTEFVCTTASKEVINLKYTIENSLSIAPTFAYTLEMVVEKQVFYNAMLLAQEMDSNFKFTATEFPPFGMFISSINGLSGSATEFWRISTRSEGRDDEPLPVGVSTYVPCDGEHIVFAYTEIQSFCHNPKILTDNSPDRSFFRITTDDNASPPQARKLLEGYGFEDGEPPFRANRDVNLTIEIFARNGEMFSVERLKLLTTNSDAMRFFGVSVRDDMEEITFQKEKEPKPWRGDDEWEITRVKTDKVLKKVIIKVLLHIHDESDPDPRIHRTFLRGLKLRACVQ